MCRYETTHSLTFKAVAIQCRVELTWSRDAMKQRVVQRAISAAAGVTRPVLRIHSLTAARNRLWVVGPSILTGRWAVPMRQQHDLTNPCSIQRQSYVDWL